MPKKNKLILCATWTVAVIATFSSLYLSEVKGFIPCNLCWYQRIAMYPLSILIPLGLYFEDRYMYRYILPLSITGGCIALYHYGLQKVPFMAHFPTCSTGVPCTGDYINLMGFITIPFLSLVAFSLITVLAFLHRSCEQK